MNRTRPTSTSWPIHDDEHAAQRDETADQINLAEDDASQEAYKSGFGSGKNGGSGFGEWKMTNESPEFQKK